MAKTCLGLDIGSSHIKIVELAKHGRHGYQVLAYAKIPTPKNAFIQARVNDANALSIAIRKLMTMLDTKTDKVILGLNGVDLMMKQLTLPLMPKKELEQAVDFELDNLFKLPPNKTLDDLSISYDVGRQTPTDQTVLVVGCPKSFMKPYVDAAKSADLVTQIVDVAAFTLPRLISDGKRCCHVDLGEYETIIYVELDGFFTLYRVLPIGGAMINEAISQAYEVDERTADKLKLEYDIDYLLVNGTGPKSLLRSLIQQYVGGILQTLDYLRSQARGSSIRDVIDQVVLSGGNAHLAGLANLLQEEIGIDVIRLDPFSDFSLASELEVPEDNCIYSNALGLALRGLTEK